MANNHLSHILLRSSESTLPIRKGALERVRDLAQGTLFATERQLPGEALHQEGRSSGDELHEKINAVSTVQSTSAMGIVNPFFCNSSGVQTTPDRPIGVDPNRAG